MYGELVMNSSYSSLSRTPQDRHEIASLLSAFMRYWADAGLMLLQCLRCWPNIKPILGQHFWSKPVHWHSSLAITLAEFCFTACQSRRHWTLLDSYGQHCAHKLCCAGFVYLIETVRGLIDGRHSHIPGISLAKFFRQPEILIAKKYLNWLQLAHWRAVSAAPVIDGGPAVNQHWFNVLYLLG